MFIDAAARACHVLGMTAMLFAVHADYSECVRQLLYAGASPDGPAASPDGACVDGDDMVCMTPLVAAMSNNSVLSLRLLLQSGCSLDMASRVDGVDVMLPADLLATGRCANIVERLVLTAATALGLQVTAACRQG